MRGTGGIRTPRRQCWLCSRFAGGSFQPLKVAIVGDVLHSRGGAFPNSRTTTLATGEVRVEAAENLGSRWHRKNGVNVFHRMEEGIADADVVIALQLQRERMQTALLPSEREFSSCMV